MSSRKPFLYNFRKSPLLRGCLFLLLIVVAIVAVIIYNAYNKVYPSVFSISPQTAAGGDTMVITGSGFGERRSDSYVELNGTRLVSSSYFYWQDDEIRLTLPMSVDDGLLYVVTPVGRSGSMVFTNKDALPIVTSGEQNAALPFVSEISESQAAIGSELTISGKNFGPLRRDSQVLFTAASVSGEEQELIACSLFDSDYLFWSDYEIKVRVPDGAGKGPLFVKTDKGCSNGTDFAVVATNGSKTYADPHTYVIRIQDTITDVDFKDAADEGIVMVFMPKPAMNAWQREPVVMESVPEPLISDFQTSVLHQLSVRKPVETAAEIQAKENAEKNAAAESDTAGEPEKTEETVQDEAYGVLDGEADDTAVSAETADSVLTSEAAVHETVLSVPEKAVIAEASDTFAVKVWLVDGRVTSKTMRNSDKINEAYGAYLRPDDVVPSDDERITDLAASIVKKEKSTYQKSLMIYNHILSSYKILQDNRPNWEEIFDTLETGYGDAYDFAILYTALCRAAGVPAIPVAGILVDTDLKAKNHWWCEVYLEGIGWFPVDPAMGAGLEYEIFEKQQNPGNFYFGSLDSQHIAFSRGFNDIKKSQSEGKSVYRARRFALQSVWEKASEKVEQFHSEWSGVQVLAVN